MAAQPLPTITATGASREHVERRIRYLQQRDRRAARRLQFITRNRLSHDEVTALDTQFDPGPEYDA